MAPQLISFVGLFVLCNAAWGEVEDACVSPQCKALLECVLKGIDEIKSVNYDGLTDIGQQVHEEHWQQVLSIKC